MALRRRDQSVSAPLNRNEAAMKDSTLPEQSFSESVDTRGWDTISAVRLDTLNDAIIQGETSPKSFLQDAEGGQVCARFQPWQISPDSDGRILTLQLEMEGLVVTDADGERTYPSARAMVDVYLDLLPHDVSDDGSVTKCLLVVDLKPQPGNEQAARVTDAWIEGHHSLVDLAYLRIGLDDWMNENLHAFTHVFATVNIHHTVPDDADFRWLKPNRVGYAFGYDQLDPEHSIMAVLCKTDGRTEEGLPYQVEVDALPDGLTVSYLISRQLFMKDMLKPSVVRSFDGMKESDLSFSHEDTVMKITSDVELKDVVYEDEVYDMTLEEFKLTLRETDFRVETLASSKVFPGIWSVVHAEAAYGIKMVTNDLGEKTLGYWETEPLLTEKTQRTSTGIKVLEWMFLIIGAVCALILTFATFGVGSIVPTVLAGIIIGCGIGALSIDIIEAVNDGNGPAIDMLVLNATDAISWSIGSRFIPTKAGLNGALSIAGDFEVLKATGSATSPARQFQDQFAGTMAARKIVAPC